MLKTLLRKLFNRFIPKTQSQYVNIKDALESLEKEGYMIMWTPHENENNCDYY